jgi:leader peptidase (prepilin peptidase)/N-methyltransferase
MLLTYIVVILLGGVAGFWLEKLTAYLIKKRTSIQAENKFSISTVSTLIWMITNSICWFGIVYIGGINSSVVEIILIFSACIVLSAVDIVTRKIPNELILFLLFVGIAFVFINNQTATVNLNLIGFVVGFVLFYLPALIGKAAGWGDVKFAAIVGLCLGIYNFFAAMVVMGVLVIPYLMYIVLTGKGNLKTKIAYGPFMASSFVIVLLLNVMNIQYNLFDFGIFLK